MVLHAVRGPRSKAYTRTRYSDCGTRSSGSIFAPQFVGESGIAGEHDAQVATGSGEMG